ncbi:MAG TPA: FAD-dependent monooxygenase [Miltoncostaeaceae bacterium]|nr:FAD-dependent monooxygenase [Miltoncostaeaceae bacterium]
MKVVISGGGMVGMTLARLLRMRGVEPVVFERMHAGAYIPRGYMLGYQGYPPLEEVGVLSEVRAQGWDIAPREDGSSVALCVAVGKLLNALARDLPVEYEHTVTDLVRDDSGRIVGVVAQGPEGERTFEADLVIACDGIGSPVRRMAGLEANFEPLAEAALTWMCDTPGSVSFGMAYLSDGGHIGTLGWPEGSAGWRSIPKIGAEAALAPGVEAVKESWTRLLPESEQGVSGLTSIDQVRYSEPQLMTCPEWWMPGLVLIGDSAHFFGPETGVSSGLGLGDAHALAEAIRQNPDDPDAACRSYVTWRAPVIRPYEAMDPGRQRMVPAGTTGLRPEERWPPEL